MAIEGIIQPEFIQIDEQLRLRKYDGHHDFAFDWYQDIETVKLVDGVDEIYSFNEGSRRCFEKAGFQVYEETENGKRYKCIIM